MFASPWATNSWLRLMRWRVWPAIDLAIEAASTSPSTAIAKRPGDESADVVGRRDLGVHGTAAGSPGSPRSPQPRPRPGRDTSTITPAITMARSVPGQNGRESPDGQDDHDGEQPPAPGWPDGLADPETPCPTSERRKPPAATLTPRKLGSCLNAIRTAAPALNPRITACETKLRKTPRRARPIPIWITPTINAQQESELEVVRRPDRCEARKGGEDHQRHGGGRPGDQVRRAAPEAGDDRGHDGGVEPVLDRAALRSARRPCSGGPPPPRRSDRRRGPPAGGGSGSSRARG